MDNLDSSNSSSFSKDLLISTTYICEKCNQIPKLLFEENKVRVTCSCNPKTTMTISINEFLEKSRRQSSKQCSAHKDKKGIKFCPDCNIWLCTSCADSHKVIPFTKDHQLLDNELMPILKCQSCQKNTSHTFCFECLKSLCESCAAKEHNEHYLKKFTPEEKEQIIKKAIDNSTKAKNLNEKMKNFKNKLIEKINSEFAKYNETFMNFSQFTNVLNNGLIIVGKNSLNFNVINNLDANIPNISETELIDSGNINEKSIQAFFDICSKVSKVKDIIILPDGDYIGEVRDGKRCGPGVFYGLRKEYKGEVTEGVYENDRRQGFTKILFANGDKFEGQVLNGDYEGFGKFQSKDGDIFEGNMKNGIHEGKGKYKFKTGETYEGEFKNGDFEGYGKYTWTDGNWFEGFFKKGAREGLGTKYDSKGKIIEEGRYKDDKLITKL